MTNINVRIEGSTPLMLNAFSDASAVDATNGTRASTKGGNDTTPMEDAESRLYKDNDGKIVMPQTNLFRAVIDAGKFFKIGRNKVTTQKSSLVPSAVSIHELTIPILHKEPWTVDTRPVRIPATGGRILRHRPLFNDWSMEFTLLYEPDIMGAKLVRDLIDAAGSRIGLGDFRPDCKGPYGKFVVTNWSPQD